MAMPPTRRDRWLALALLLAVIALAYLLLVHPWFTRPLLDINADITDLQEPVAYYLRGEEYTAQIDAFVHPAPATAVGRGEAERRLERHRERRFLGGDAIHVHPVKPRQQGVRPRLFG